MCVVVCMLKVSVRRFVSKHVCMCPHMYLYFYICVHVHVCIYVCLRYMSKISYVFPRVCADSLPGKLKFSMWYSANIHSVSEGNGR